MDANDLLPASEEAKFLNIRYDERWHALKPVIVELYMNKYGPGGKTMTIQQVASFMKLNYSFFAARWFRQWGVRKRVETHEKVDITSVLGRRSHSSMSTSDVILHQGPLEKSVDKRQLKRKIKDQMRQYQPEPLSPGVLSSWNLPYDAYVKCIRRNPDQPSPFGEASAIPAYLSIRSPEAVTPGRRVGPSPTMKLVQQKVVQDRSSLLLQGRFAELLSSCGREDRVALTNYLHDFYIHSFVSAKYWGKGPKLWTVGMVSALTLECTDAADPFLSPTALSPSRSSGLALPSGTGERLNRFNAPTSLCRWSIHVPHIDYAALDEQPSASEPEEFDIERPSSWDPWHKDDLASNSLPRMMQESIQDSTFTRATVEELPISVGLISKSVQDDSTPLLADSWRLAIISGNRDLLRRLCESVFMDEDVPEEILQIHPFHLAASYLDGGNTCCLLFKDMLEVPGFRLRRRNINDTGQTILDSLLMSVFRSHTSVSPDHVGLTSGPLSRYPGEEKDICGRWDADSPRVRELFGHGYARIPTSWKHPLCHTATQAICHATIGCFGSLDAPDINTRSGLFVRRCVSCGLELKAGPLHALVILAFYLAQKGMAGETLFGAMAILACLMRLGASVSDMADISVEEILGTTEAGGCLHAPLTPRDLMAAVPSGLIDHWTEDCRIGWDCIHQALHLGEECEAERDFDDMDEDPADWSQQDPEDPDSDTCWMKRRGAHGDWLQLPCGNPKLGAFWAAIQVELLTYRRVEEGAPWISKNFSMHALRAWLTGETEEFHTPLLENNMIKGHSRCGWFSTVQDFTCPLAQEVCVEHFMNMDVYSRTSFIEQPDFSQSWVEYA